MQGFSGEAISDSIWKWKHKLLHQKKSLLNEPVNVESEYKEENIEDITSKDSTFGADAVIQTLYEGKKSNGRTEFDWKNVPPKPISKSAVKARDRVAIKVYKIKDDKDQLSGRSPLKYHRIDVQNPLLVSALEPLLKKENLHLDVHDIATFEEPFYPLWFCQDGIKDLYRETSKDDPVKEYLQLFIRVLDECFRDLKVKRHNLLDKGLIDFRIAWTLFPRDSTIYSSGVKSESIAKVDRIKYCTELYVDSLNVTCKTIFFNGKEFIWKEKVVKIVSFSGNKPIRDLDHYPFDMHLDKDSIQDRLVARGKKVLDLQGLTYCSYSGIALKEELETMKHDAEGRILVDVAGHKEQVLCQKSFGEYPGVSAKDVVYSLPNPSQYEHHPHDPVNYLGKRWLSEEYQRLNKEMLLKRPNELAFMSELIGGYTLKNKFWGKFYVEDIEPVEWNDKAYDHLVFDPQQKDLVLSFVDNHSRAHGVPTIEGDVIVGKGQGLIILLSGPPGTGKTLMAEAIADRARRPLFNLQAEDLGISADTLGKNLKSYFKNATKWNAVILLDEADVFMAERNPNDIHRNELVSIFLRELEYFRGIIFLTTNLYQTIDTAFRSRVSLHLRFEALDRKAREAVWRKFLQLVPENDRVTGESPDTGSTTPRNSDIDEGAERDVSTSYDDKPLDNEDIAELSLWQLNGREIKTAVKMARSWCGYKGYALTLSRLENSVKTTSPLANKDGDVDESLYD